MQLSITTQSQHQWQSIKIAVLGFDASASLCNFLAWKHSKTKVLVGTCCSTNSSHLNPSISAMTIFYWLSYWTWKAHWQVGKGTTSILLARRTRARAAAWHPTWRSKDTLQWLPNEDEGSISPTFFETAIFGETDINKPIWQQYASDLSETVSFAFWICRSIRKIHRF